MVSSARQLAIEPSLGGSQIAPHRDGGDFEHFGRFVRVQPGKEAHFDHPDFPRFHLFERVQGIIQRHQIRGPIAAHNRCFIQRHVQTGIVPPMAAPRTKPVWSKYSRDVAARAEHARAAIMNFLPCAIDSSGHAFWPL